jgi:hypothetical protein
MELKSCAPNSIDIKGEDSTKVDGLCFYHTKNMVDFTSAQARPRDENWKITGKEETLPIRGVDFQMKSKFWAWISVIFGHLEGQTYYVLKQKSKTSMDNLRNAYFHHKMRRGKKKDQELCENFHAVL